MHILGQYGDVDRRVCYRYAHSGALPFPSHAPEARPNHSLTCQYELRPLDNYWAIFDFGVCGVYSNTLLANLNARNYARGDETVTFTFENSGSPNKTGSPGRGLPPLSTGDTTTMGYSGYATGETRFTNSARTDESVTPRDLVTFVTAKEELNSPISKEGRVRVIEQLFIYERNS